jgi:hypothetical protein
VEDAFNNEHHREAQGEKEGDAFYEDAEDGELLCGALAPEHPKPVRGCGKNADWRVQDDADADEVKKGEEKFEGQYDEEEEYEIRAVELYFPVFPFEDSGDHLGTRVGDADRKPDGGANCGAGSGDDASGCGALSGAAENSFPRRRYRASGDRPADRSPAGLYRAPPSLPRDASSHGFADVFDGPFSFACNAAPRPRRAPFGFCAPAPDAPFGFFTPLFPFVDAFSTAFFLLRLVMGRLLGEKLSERN